MTLDISVAARNAACDAIVDLIDAGGTGYLELRTGPQPATPATADSGTLLATLPFSSPAFGSASAGAATANSITSDTNVDTSGTAAHFRIKNQAGTVIMQGSVGTSGADLNFNTVTFVAGGTAAISAITVSTPQ